MDKELKELWDTFEKEYEKKQREIDKINSDIDKLNIKKKSIIFNTLKKAMDICEDK